MKLLLIGLLTGVLLFAHAQDITIRDIDYRSDVYLNHAEENSIRLIYKVLRKDQRQSLFRKIDFDTLLHLHDTTEIQLAGQFRLLSSAQNERYMVTALGSTQIGGVSLHWLDQESEEQQVTKLPLSTMYTKRMQVRVHPSSQPDAFFVLYPVNKRQWEVLLVESGGKVISKQSIQYGSEKINVTKSTFINDDLVLVVGRNHVSRKAQYHLKILDGQTGVEERDEAISAKGAKLAIDNTLLIDSTLYLTGRKFFRNRVKHNDSGLPSLVSYDSRSDNFKDQPLGTAAFPVKIFWMDMLVTPDGKKYLVGETFTSEAFGGYMAKAVLTSLATMGMLSVTWSSLKWHDVIIMPVEVERSSPVMLTLAKRRVQVGSHMAAYMFAGYAYTVGQVRYFGHDKQGSLYLLNGTMFNKYVMRTNEMVELGQLPAPHNSRVIFLSDTYSIVTHRGTGRLNLEVFQYQPISKKR
jgi:hypothetical protein